MRHVEYTKTFRRDIKREKKGQRSKEELETLLFPIIEALANDEPLETRLRDHALSGIWRGCRDCHIRPDLVLIYSKPDAEKLLLLRLGSHSELRL